MSFPCQPPRRWPQRPFPTHRSSVSKTNRSLRPAAGLQGVPMACRITEWRPLGLCEELVLVGGESLRASPSHGRERQPWLPAGLREAAARVWR